MVRSFLLAASLSLCWTLSPDALVLLGNGFGRHGLAFALALLAGAVLSAAAANLLRSPLPSAGGDDRLPGERYTFWSAPLHLAGAVSPALFLPTGMLVTAGFTFNETFVYWFPNFGFSFLLLLLVTAVHLAGERVILTAQLVFFLLNASCLLLLGLAGLLVESPQEGNISPPPAIETAFPAILPLAMLLFLGYDRHLPESGRDKSSSIAAVGVGFLLLTLWGLASLQHIPQARLAESSVPHMAAARAVLDQPGRLIMGTAIISGTCAAVSGLFHMAVGAVHRTMGGSCEESNPGRCFWPPKIQVILTSLAVAIFLALGLAGSDSLEVFIFGSLILWLMSVGGSCLATARHMHQHSLFSYAMSGILFTASAFLVVTHPQRQLLFVFCLVVLIAGGGLSAIFGQTGRTRPYPSRE